MPGRTKNVHACALAQTTALLSKHCGKRQWRHFKSVGCFIPVLSGKYKYFVGQKAHRLNAQSQFM